MVNVVYGRMNMIGGGSADFLQEILKVLQLASDIRKGLVHILVILICVCVALICILISLTALTM